MKLKIIQKFNSPFKTVTYIQYLIPENDFEVQVVRVITMLRRTVKKLERQWRAKAVREGKVEYGQPLFDYHSEDGDDL